MEAVRRTVELGRAARAQAAVKVRQPLRRAVVVANDAEREAIRPAADLVTAELNVKELEFVAEESELVSYEVKPNYRALGPALRQADAAGRRRGRGARRRRASPRRSTAGREVGINVDGREHALGPDDMTLVLQPLDGYQVEAEAGHAVALGARARRRAAPRGPRARDRPRGPERPPRGRPRGHRPDRAGLGGDAELLDAARAHEAYLAGETLATAVAYDGADGDATADDRGPRAPDRRGAIRPGGRLIALAAVIFDLDGVLIDSEPVVGPVREELTRESGWPLARGRRRRR